MQLTKMSERIFVASLKCAYCHKRHKPIKGYPKVSNLFFAPANEILTFVCEFCGKRNQIVETYKAVKLEE